MERTVKAIVKILVPIEISINFTLVGGNSQFDLRAIRKFITGKEEEKIAVSFGDIKINAIGENEIGEEFSDVSLNDTVLVNAVLESINNNIDGGYKSEILTTVSGE